MKLSESKEDYLKTILTLIMEEGHAHAKKIAEALSVKMPSVTVALRSLADSGLITYVRNYPVELTPLGRRLAERVLRRHNALEAFLNDVLGLSPPKAAATACRLEHLLDDKAIRNIRRLTLALADGQQVQLPLGDAVEGGDEAGEAEEEAGTETAERG